MLQETKILLDLFQVEGKPASEKITEGQIEIFEDLIYRRTNRSQIETPTQYGKSMTVALACLIISCIQEEIVAVVAPTTEKAKEIMRYYIDHLGDNVLFFSQLEKNTRLDRLKQEESKNRIILRNGGGIYTLSTNERNFSRSIESAMGKGARVTIMDEAGLIRDETEATIFRMIAGKGKDAFYCKIGNPFYSEPPYSHFYKSSHDSKYKKIWIDYKQGLREGRYTQGFIEEARDKPMFDVLFEVKFPAKQEIDDEGFRFLLSDETIENCKAKELPKSKENKILGSDIGEGNNANVHAIRQGSGMWVENKNKSKNLMAQVGIIEEIGAYEGFIDKTGVGAGVSSRCDEKGLNTQGINWGSRAEDNKQFANLKAENYWAFKKWIENGGKILWSDDWEELRHIKYKINSSGKVQMEPKERMQKRGLESPDTSDGGALTFNNLNKPTIELI